MIPHRLGRLLGAVLLLAPSLAFGQTALQQPNVAASPGITVDPLPAALTKLYQNDLFLQTLVANRFSALGAAALLNVGTITGTVADGGALAAEIARAQGAEQSNATAIQTNATAISTETSRAQAAEALKAPLTSPAFTGTPTAPTAASGMATTQVATTKFVTDAVAAGGGGGGGVPPSRQILTSGLATGGGDLSVDRTITVPKAAQSDVAAGTDDAKALTSLSVAARLGALAPLASPQFVGTPVAPTAAAGTNSTQIATTAFAQALPFLSYGSAQGLTSGQQAQARANAGISTTGALSFRNRIINGAFTINQRGVATASTAYAAGTYTYDRWKAGSAGVTVSVSTAANGDGTASITAGTFAQVIEGALYLPEGGTYVASWSGTATCRFYQGTATGSYVASPLAITGATAGANGTLECSTGTLTQVQLEPGTQATAYERRDDELRRCQRYYETGTFAILGTATAAGQYFGDTVSFKVTKRPGLTVVPTNTLNSNGGAPTANPATVDRTRIYVQSAGAGNLEDNGTYTAASEL